MNVFFKSVSRNNFCEFMYNCAFVGYWDERRPKGRASLKPMALCGVLTYIVAIAT